MRDLHYCPLLYVYIDTYRLVELLNDRSSVQIPFNVPPPTTTTNIRLYINLQSVDNYMRWHENSAIVAHLSVLSSYSGVSLPVNNTILPVVTLTGPNGSEGTTVDIPLNRESLSLDQCYDNLQNLNHTYISVKVNIHSPPMYTQLGEYDFIISLFLYSPERLALNITLSHEFPPDSYTVTVNIVSSGKPYTVLINLLNATMHVCIYVYMFSSTFTLLDGQMPGDNSQKLIEGKSYNTLCVSLYTYTELYLPFNLHVHAGVDYLTFLEQEHMEQIFRNQDGSSTSINIPTGLPFENSIQTTAFVSEKYPFNIYYLPNSIMHYIFVKG